MRRPAAALLSLALTASQARPDTLASLEAAQTALYERVAPGVAVVTGPGTIGAAFAVAPGLLLTAAHVVPGLGEVTVTLRDGRTMRGTVVERAAGGLDVALVRIPVTPPLLELARSSPLRPGSVVATIGHPDGNRFVLGTGLVAQAQGDATDAALVRLQLPLRAGASGGPVVDRSGRVVGVVALGAAGTVTFAVRAEAAVRALSGLSHVPVSDPAPTARAAPIADAVPLAIAPPPPAAPREAAPEAAPDDDPPPFRAPDLVVGPADPRPPELRVASAGGARAPDAAQGRRARRVVAPALLPEGAAPPRATAAYMASAPASTAPAARSTRPPRAGVGAVVLFGVFAAVTAAALLRFGAGAGGRYARSSERPTP